MVRPRSTTARFPLPNGAELALEARGSGAELRLSANGIELSASGDPSGGDDTVELVIRHPLSSANTLWVPHLTPSGGQVAGDAVFRAPAVIVADASMALALIPDLDDARHASGYRLWLDYDHPQATVTLGLGAYRAEGHVFFSREPARRAEGATWTARLHILASTGDDDRQNPYRLAARFLWERWGHTAHQSAPPPPMARHMARIVRWAFSSQGWGESVWQDVELEGAAEPVGAPVFIVDVTRHPSVPLEQRRWREPRSIWNQAWFSTQRCANGLLRYARQIGSNDLLSRARRMTEVALLAPERETVSFPAVLVATEASGPRGWRWCNSDRRPPSASEDACHLVDAACTARLLLEWHALTSEPRAWEKPRRLAERLLRMQRPSGAFPGWVEPDGRVPSELAEGPESAVAASLLLDLAHEEPRYLQPARRALVFLEGVVHAGRWEDFETYYSCAPWGAPERIGKRVPRNGVYKQNTLSIAWCAEAFFRAQKLTGEPRYRTLARRCIDELSLYQAVWDPPFLPAPAHGGFGVMNADSEWNDARQSLYAPLYLELGTAWKDPELIERGMAALRASFTMLYAPENTALARAYEERFPFFGPESYGFMMENQGHGTAHPIGTFTIYTWGNGSALAAAATVKDRFPELALACGLP